jgi:putative ABC transport system substrate-binding protein
MAIQRLQRGVRPQAVIETLRDVQTAVNIRTAEHLGLNFDGILRRKFGMVFPASP